MPVYEEKGLVNGQKRWFIRTYVTDEYGKKKQITKHNKEWLGREGKKEAECEEKKLQNKTYYSSSNITLERHIKNYLEIKQNELEKTSFQLYKQIINLYIIKYIPTSKRINKFTRIDAVKYKQDLNTLNLSIKTKKNAYVILENIFDLAHKLYNIENVFKTVGNFVITKKDVKHEMNILTEDEFKEFISFENDMLYRAFFIILFYTGMRKGELLGLNWDNVDINNKSISITNNYSTNYKIEIKPKTLTSYRTIIISDIVNKTLTELKNNNKTFYLFKDVIKATTLREHCQKNLKKANILKKIRIHDFRHSFASMCINRGVPIEIISEYLGHRRISTTLDIYGHVYPNSQKKLIDVF